LTAVKRRTENWWVSFPLSVQTDVTASGIWTMSLVEMFVSDIGSVWKELALPQTYVWNVHQDEHRRPRGSARGLDAEGIAKSRAVDVTGYDVEWARADRAPAREGIHELIRIRSSQIPRFVDHLHVFDFEMIDSSRDLSEAELDELMLNAQSREPGAQLLDRFAWASNYLANHDECYMWQEARADDLLRATVSRYLITFVTASTQVTLDVAPPSGTVLDQLMEPGTGWTAPLDMVTVSEDSISLAVCRGAWQLGDDLPRAAAHTLRFRFDTGTWEWLAA
jgi:hypothetical protein